MQQRGTFDVEEKDIIAEDYKHDVGTTPIHKHFNGIIDDQGEANICHPPKFISNLAKYFLPHALLWSGVMLGDPGRHGTGPACKMW
ncbi:hypothetical protein VZT92_008171 [Zoarces viviparus]|uniref:Uncharacterized protein n=1 Tax=Zoarces viviparus TaxID=48416 RepID=A0AAW1FLW8_ZOAVI